MRHEGESGPDEPVVGARASHDGGRGCRREVFDYFFGWGGGEREDMLAAIFWGVCVCMFLSFFFPPPFNKLGRWTEHKFGGIPPFPHPSSLFEKN